MRNDQYQVQTYYRGQGGKWVTRVRFRGTREECEKWVKRHSEAPYNEPALQNGYYHIVPAE